MRRRGELVARYFSHRKPRWLSGDSEGKRGRRRAKIPVVKLSNQLALAQLLAQNHGNVEILGERECSIPRRYQKLIEESPSPPVTAQMRQTISDSLKKAMREVGYTNTGTVEFLMDEDGSLYFFEVNARVKVEYPVTMRGHAMEFRINSEHPETFTPGPGKITWLNLPGGIGVRVDTWAYTDCVIPPYYDSLIAKLIVHGKDRGEAIQRSLRALDMLDAEFQAGEIDTGFIGWVPG